MPRKLVVDDFKSFRLRNGQLTEERVSLRELEQGESALLSMPGGRRILWTTALKVKMTPERHAAMQAFMASRKKG
jgi:hypothetical protein